MVVESQTINLKKITRSPAPLVVESQTNNLRKLTSSSQLLWWSKVKLMAKGKEGKEKKRKKNKGMLPHVCHGEKVKLCTQVVEVF